MTADEGGVIWRKNIRLTVWRLEEYIGKKYFHILVDLILIIYCHRHKF